MLRFAFIALLLIASSALANINQRLPDNTWAYYGDDFYRVLATKKDVQKDYLFNILTTLHSSTDGDADTFNNCKGKCYRHSPLTYDEARRALFGDLYYQKDARGSYVEEVYCGKKVYFRQVTDISNMHKIVNIEHTWPQSKFNVGLGKDAQKSDMHHLYPADSAANNRRGNYWFGEDDKMPNELDLNNCDESKMITGRGQLLFTPPETHRGNVARALFYFAVRYKLPIDVYQEVTLRLWHQLDPVDEEEIERHNKIAQYQKIRNPFVDHPELVSMLKDF